MAILSKDFYAVKSGEIYPQTFKAGTECPSDLEGVAKAAGCIEVTDSKAPRKTKALKGAPENKMVK